MKKIVLLLSTIIYVSFNCYCQTGSIDLSFGEKGIIKTELGTNVGFSSIANQVLADANGSIYLVTESSGLTFIIKKHADGITDSSYGFNGISESVAIQSAQAALQADGKIVVAGRARGQDGYDHDLNELLSNYDFALACYNKEGSLEQSFGDHGKVITDINPHYDAAESIVVQADGKIIAAGFTSVFDGTYDPDGNAVHAEYIALARYNTNGSPDDTFDEDGTLITQIKTSNTVSLISVALQNDGKIAVAASNSMIGLTLNRFNLNGSLDTTFNITQNLILLNGLLFAARSVAIQNDGKIVVGGFWPAAGNQDFVLARYYPSGILDIGFSSDGIQTTDFKTHNDVINKIIIQNDGKIVAAGYASNGSNNAFAIARYTTNGNLDTTFDGDGKRMTYINANSIYITCLAVQSSGKLLAAGYEKAGTKNNIALIRYKDDGTLDSTFNRKGTLLYHFQQKETIFTSTVVQKDGKIVTAGYCRNGSDNSFVVARYNSNGTFDNTFDGDGRKIIAIGTDGHATSLAIQNDGKIVVAGYALTSSNYNFAVVRLNVNGSLDKTFSSDGKLTTDFDANPDYARSVIIQSDGKIVVAGETISTVILPGGDDSLANEDIALARYNSNGSLDNTFNGNGKLITDFASDDALSVSGEGVASVALQDNGKIVVAGHTGDLLFIIRYNANGSMDSSFSGDGILTNVIQDFVAGSSDYGEFIKATAVNIQRDGKIVMSGYGGYLNRYNDGAVYIVMARYASDGTLDDSFSDDGIQVVDFNILPQLINTYVLPNSSSFSLQDNGKIVIQTNLYRQVEESYEYYNDINIGFAFARLNSDGSFDNSFGINGMNYPDQDQYSVIRNIIIANNKVYGAGDYKSVSNFGFLTSYLLAEKKAPLVKIISPADNVAYTTPANIIISAAASDSDGTISYVRFFDGETLLGADSTSPYTHIINNAGGGYHSLVAKAADNNGLLSSSASVAVNVSSAINKAPVVFITSPATDAVYNVPVVITVKAAAADSDGTINYVEFYNNGALLAVDNTNPYDYILNNAVAGSYSFTTKAVDNQGLFSISSSVHATVLANKAPVVNIFTDDTVYTAPATINIYGEASDPDGAISYVRFYAGATLIGTDSINTGSYSFSWDNVAAGSYLLTVKVTDNHGLTTSSSVVNITVVPEGIVEVENNVLDGPVIGSAFCFALPSLHLSLQ